MSEKLYAWVLRLYPRHFRETYGDEALQLFRDRVRDETGFLARLRLWLELVADVAISVPRQYRHVESDLVGASAQQRFEGTPSFRVLNGDLPRPGALLVGFVLSLVALVTFPVLLSHRGTHRQPSGSFGAGPRAAGARSSAFEPSAPRTTGRPEAETMPPNQLPDAPSRMTAEAARSRNLRSSSVPAWDDSTLQQPQSPRPNLPAVAGVIYPSVMEEPKLDAATRHDVIKGAIANLNEYYAYPDVAQKMAASLLAHEKSGDDNEATDGNGFADLLTRQMRDVSHDRHLIVVYSQVPRPDRPPEPTPEDLARYREAMEQENCTFEKVRILPHNIGYLKLNSFPDPSICQATAKDAMASLNHVDAIIFDLRDNTGGSPDMVMLVAAYLFDHPEYMYNPRENTTERSWTLSPVPGNRLADKPVYVLTSANTFSGAEHFSYDLKMLKRATLVGETTGGAAHAGTYHRIDDHFGIGIPETRAINPFSKTDWAGTGVEPDVKVKAADALMTAEKLAESRLQKK